MTERVLPNDSATVSLSQLFSLSPSRVKAIISLLEDGNTVPFIARYRKEVTGNLEDQKLRAFVKEWERLKVLAKRKEEIIKNLKSREQLTDRLTRDIAAADSMTSLEDIYRPYKLKRETRADRAIKQGLEPLADLFLLAGMTESKLIKEATNYLDKIEERQDVEDVLQGAGDILAERIADRPDVRKGLRKLIWRQAIVETAEKSDPDNNYAMYHSYREPLRTMEAHRWLAIQRGEKEGCIRVSLDAQEEVLLSYLAKFFIPDSSRIYSRLYLICQDSWQRLLEPSLKNDLFKSKREEAEEASIKLFAANLRNLLLQPPVRGKRILGWDPGYSHGCKLAVINQRGDLVDWDTIYPFKSKQDSLSADQILADILSENSCDLVAIGNGTASRESELWFSDFIGRHKIKIPWIIVSEAGASVYSVSGLASMEFPDLDVNLRSAVSIARRVQDPLAELVKIDPKSIGVGQYQHDLNSKKLDQALREVVEDCVNQVGVDLNTASAHILAYVAGLNKKIAAEIVAKRKELSGFSSRRQLKEVKYLGPKSFEQAAGFLRIADAPLYLDRTAVHPESYAATEAIAKYFAVAPSARLGLKIAESDQKALAEKFGLDSYTLTEIRESLLKPNRDPRDDLEHVQLKTEILRASDLKPGMILQGTVRNVVAFGAFVDVGLDQDGLVHISKMSQTFVKNPLDIVKVGDQVKVEVIDYDKAGKRLALSLIRSKTRQGGRPETTKKTLLKKSKTKIGSAGQEV